MTQREHKTMNQLKNSAILILVLLLSGTAFAEDRSQTSPTSTPVDTLGLVVIMLNNEPTVASQSYCSRADQPAESDLMQYATTSQSDLEEDRYPKIVHSICRGAVGSVFGGTTGKLLARFIGGESLSRLLEFAGISEVSGHNSGKFICEELLGKKSILDSDTIDWILEPTAFIDENLAPEIVLDQIADYVPAVIYDISSIATRGAIVAFIVKRTLGIYNPVVGFVLAMPIRSVYDALLDYTEDVIYEWTYGDESTQLEIIDMDPVQPNTIAEA